MCRLYFLTMEVLTANLDSRKVSREKDIFSPADLFLEMIHKTELRDIKSQLRQRRFI